MGQQHTEWIGVAPFLEEDLAFCLDRPGRARPRRHAVRAARRRRRRTLAFRRASRPTTAAATSSSRRAPTGPTRSSATGCTTWPRSSAGRRWRHRPMPSVAAVVARARREEAYHRRHADALVARMLGDRDGGERLAAAITRLLPFADALWEPVDGEPAARGRRHRGRVVRRAAAALAGDGRGDDGARSTGPPWSAPTSGPGPGAASTSPPCTPASPRSSPSTRPPAGNPNFVRNPELFTEAARF